MISKTSVFIADDYYLIREGLKRSLKGLKQMNIVGECHDARNLISHIEQLKPDILILEVSLCKPSLTELMQALKVSSPKTKTLILSDCRCAAPVLSSITSGVSGFVPKNVDKEELIKAICEIAAGREYLSPDITKLLMHAFAQKNEIQLSEREIEILKHICKGKTNEQIASCLFLSQMTIATHKRNIMRKTGVKKTTELILWALEHKIGQVA
ncbi:MAG TPA: response regulator transcription factor [Cytophagales bacterium]|nr:response regulator transcription factor [Cytophagales bacterium]